MSSKRNWINVLTALLILSLTACNTSKKQEDLSAQCCQECLEAFSQSPAAVGAAGANCGEFTTAKPISAKCKDYFKNNPRTVAACE
jgi:YHS domain-containing protein